MSIPEKIEPSTESKLLHFPTLVKVDYPPYTRSEDQAIHDWMMQSYEKDPEHRKKEAEGIIRNIISTIRYLHDPGDVFEIACLKCRNSREYPWEGRRGDAIAGWFNKLDEALYYGTLADKTSGSAGIHVGCNPCSPDLLAVANQQIKSSEARTGSKDIIALCNLVFDFDPHRRSGISSTDKEHESALGLARKIKGDLLVDGWPEMMYCDSGNGSHLVPKLPRLANTKENLELLKNVLWGLLGRYRNHWIVENDKAEAAVLFDGIELKVDLSMANPNRLTKLYGTMARKGEHIDERPHRRSRIIEYPAKIEAVQLEQLNKLAEEGIRSRQEIEREIDEFKRKSGGKESAKEAVTVPVKAPPKVAFDLRAYLEEKGLKVVKVKELDDMTLFCVDQCVFDPLHSGNESSFIRYRDGRFGYQCFHNTCKSRTVTEAWERIGGDPAFLKRNQSTKRREPSGHRGAAQAQTLLELANEATYFISDGHEVYAEIPRGGHKEIWSVRSEVYKRWLRNEFYTRTVTAPGSDAMKCTVEVIESRTHMEGERRDIFVRVAESNGRVYIDLVNEAWEVVEIGTDGWQIIKDSPVNFRRADGMKALPRPERGGSLSELKGLVNVAAEEDFMMIAGFIVMCFWPAGPYPLLVFEGEQECGKTTLTRLIKTLVDPCQAQILSPPRNEDDFWTFAKNTWLPCYDNLSVVKAWLSDSLCRQATGGGHGKRTLYSNDEVTAFEISRPCILNGIDNIAQRGDLISRSMILVLPTIPKSKRIDEATYYRELQRVAPRVLGAVCDALSAALRNRSTINLKELPRMAVFAKIIAAAEEALPWEKGRFLEAYSKRTEESYAVAVDADAVAAAIRKFMAKPRNSWTGTSEQLLKHLRGITDYETQHSKYWPKDATRLSTRLTRITTMLRAAGIDVKKEPRSSVSRQITITRMLTKPFVPCVVATGDAIENSVIAASSAKPLMEPENDANDASDALFSKREKEKVFVDSGGVQEETPKIENLASLPSRVSLCKDSSPLNHDGKGIPESSIASPCDTTSTEAGDPELQENRGGDKLDVKPRRVTSTLTSETNHGVLSTQLLMDQMSPSCHLVMQKLSEVAALTSSDEASALQEQQWTNDKISVPDGCAALKRAISHYKAKATKAFP